MPNKKKAILKKIDDFLNSKGADSLTSLDVTKTGKKDAEKIMRKIGHITYFEDIRNQKLQKRAAELASKYGDKAKVEVKGNKIVVTGADGRDTWTVT